MKGEIGFPPPLAPAWGLSFLVVAGFIGGHGMSFACSPKAAAWGGVLPYPFGYT